MHPVVPVRWFFLGFDRSSFPLHGHGTEGLSRTERAESQIELSRLVHTVVKDTAALERGGDKNVVFANRTERQTVTRGWLSPT